jgi:hypothetical protein
MPSLSLTLPYRDGLAEQEDHRTNNEVVIPTKVASQVPRVDSGSNKDESKDCEGGDDREALLLSALYHGN